jgi:hypothetical protein
MLARRWLLLTLASFGIHLLGGAGRSFGADDPTTGDADLKETLLFGLRPRTPAEEQFIDYVVAKVDAGQLPLTLVISTFRWAQVKKPYPFPYFERGLKERARQVGIIL